MTNSGRREDIGIAMSYISRTRAKARRAADWVSETFMVEVEVTPYKFHHRAVLELFIHDTSAGTYFCGVGGDKGAIIPLSVPGLVSRLDKILRTRNELDAWVAEQQTAQRMFEAEHDEPALANRRAEIFNELLSNGMETVQAEVLAELRLHQKGRAAGYLSLQCKYNQSEINQAINQLIVNGLVMPRDMGDAYYATKKRG